MLLTKRLQPMNCIYDLANFLASVATIGGFIFAFYAYFNWKKDYALQISHDFALDLLKKINVLQLDIQKLRGPKFYNPKNIPDQIENIYVPMINEIREKTLNILTDLLIAKHTLQKNKDFFDIFNAEINNAIIGKINKAYITFALNQKDADFQIKKTLIWKIIFPFECIEDDVKTVNGLLGIPQVDDDFNKLINVSFKKVCTLLDENVFH